MIEVVYYRHPEGSEPEKDWLYAQDNRVRQNIRTRLQDLEKKGLDLIGTHSLDTIRGPDRGLYELRNRGLGWRIAFYHDLRHAKFILLWAWNKTKHYERDIFKSRTLLHEYLSQG